MFIGDRLAHGLRRRHRQLAWRAPFRSSFDLNFICNAHYSLKCNNLRNIPMRSTAHGIA